MISEPLIFHFEIHVEILTESNELSLKLAYSTPNP